MENVSLSAAEILVRWWETEQTGIKKRSATSSEIEEFERRCDVELPTSFQDYLARACPVEDPSWDNELTNWWPIESLRTVAQGYEHELGTPIAAYRDKLVLFADFSVWCWAWAINCAPGADHGKVAVIAGDEHDRFIAESFDSFVQKYVQDCASVFP